MGYGFCLYLFATSHLAQPPPFYHQIPTHQILYRLHMSIRIPLIPKQRPTISCQKLCCRYTSEMDDSQITQKGILARSQDYAQKVNAAWAAVLALVAIPGSVLAAWHWLLPNISITSGTVASNISPLETEYTIKNNGNISLYDVVLGCKISSAHMPNYAAWGNTVNVPGRSMSQYVPLLVPGGVASRNCGGAPFAIFPQMTYPATIIVWATAKWPWPFPVLSWTEAESFKSVKDSDGRIQITPDTP
jgi:hypothetical protein